jgi:hypothetical protein
MATTLVARARQLLKAKAARDRRRPNPPLEIVVTERRRYIVPELLRSEVEGAIKLKDAEYLDELISSLEYREGAEEITTVNVRIAK